MKFFHSIPISNDRDSYTAHEITATWKHGSFVHSAKNHDRYFASLDEFVRWHYVSQGWKIIDEAYPFGGEAKSLYSETCELFAYQPMWIQKKHYAAHLKIESRN